VHVPKGAGDSTLASLELVPAANRAAWRLHHVTSNDTLETIAKAYNTAPERIVAVNSTFNASQTGSLVEGDTLLIPAEFHEERMASAHSTAHSNSRLSARSSSHSVASHSSHSVTHVAASSRSASAHTSATKRVPAQLLHRKAAVHTASIQR
jgi:hypothetical protein